MLGPGPRHDALGLLLVLVVVEANGLELGAPFLLVDSAGQVLHAEAAQLAGPLGDCRCSARCPGTHPRRR